MRKPRSKPIYEYFHEVHLTHAILGDALLETAVYAENSDLAVYRAVYAASRWRGCNSGDWQFNSVKVSAPCRPVVWRGYVKSTVREKEGVAKP